MKMKMMEMLAKVIKRREGQGMVEYGLIIAGIAIAAIVAIWAFGGKITALFNGINFSGPA